MKADFLAGFASLATTESIQKYLIAIIVLIAIAIIGIFIVVFIRRLKEKKTEAEAFAGKENKNKTSGLDRFRIAGSSKNNLPAFNKFVKDFLRNYLNEKKEMAYSEIAEILKKKKKNELANFCEKMNSALYSGKELTKSEFFSLINEFEKITRVKKQALESREAEKALKPEEPEIEIKKFFQLGNKPMLAKITEFPKKIIEETQRKIPRKVPIRIEKLSLPKPAEKMPALKPASKPLHLKHLRKTIPEIAHISAQEIKLNKKKIEQERKELLELNKTIKKEKKAANKKEARDIEEIGELARIRKKIAELKNELKTK